MDKETFLSKLLEVGTIEDAIERRNILTELTDGIEGVFNDIDNLNTTISSLNENLTKTNNDLEKANKANMDLFLRVGSQKSSAEVNSVETGTGKEPEKRKFEDLFKTEGGDN